MSNKIVGIIAKSGIAFFLCIILMSHCESNRQEYENRKYETVLEEKREAETVERIREENEIVLEERLQTIFEEKEIYNQDGLSIKLNKCDSSKMKFTVENNTTGTKSVSIESIAVNSIMDPTQFFFDDASDLAVGKKGTISYNIDDYDNARYIDVIFEITDSDYNNTYTDIIRIESNKNDGVSDVVHFENSQTDRNLEFYCTDITDNKITISIINNNDRYLGVGTIEDSVNDWACDQAMFFSKGVFPNCQLFEKIEIDRDFMEENGIESIENYECIFRTVELDSNMFDYKTPRMKFEK